MYHKINRNDLSWQKPKYYGCSKCTNLNVTHVTSWLLVKIKISNRKTEKLQIQYKKAHYQEKGVVVPCNIQQQTIENELWFCHKQQGLFQTAPKCGVSQPGRMTHLSIILVMQWFLIAIASYVREQNSATFFILNVDLISRQLNFADLCLPRN